MVKLFGLLGPNYLYMPGLPLWFHWAIYLLLVIVIGLTVFLFAKRLQRIGISVGAFGKLLVRSIRSKPLAVLRTEVQDVLGQRRVRRNSYAAVMHVTIFASYIMLTLGTTFIAVQHDLTSRLFDFSFLHGYFYLVEKFLLDTAALGLVAGVIMAAFRRYSVRPSHLGTRPYAGIAYVSLLVMAVTGLILEATRELAYPISWAWWTYAGHLLADGIAPLVGGAQIGTYQTVWIIHVAAAFLFMGTAFLTLLDHVLILPINIALQAGRVPGALRLPFRLEDLLQDENASTAAGFANPADLDITRKFMLDSCINCGRCEAVCPATATGRHLSPRKLIQALRTDLRADNTGDGDLIIRNVIEEDTLWSCLTCGACQNECPVWIDQPGIIVDIRRYLNDEGRLDTAKTGALRQLERNQNPLGQPAHLRASWIGAEGLPTIDEMPNPDYLYWLGCMASFDERSKNIAVSVIRLLRHAGVSIATLGNQEVCTGEFQRKLGDEIGFQTRAIEIIETLRNAGVKKILTHCPHCFVTFSKDYLSLGAEFEVIHHSQLLAELLADGRITVPFKEENQYLTFHDPCNLGRLSGEFDAPRSIAAELAGKGFVELERSRDRSFCCGAGGANYFYKVPQAESVSGARLAQAIDVKATTLATACPFCLSMLEDAASVANEDAASPRIADLAELLAEALALN